MFSCPGELKKNKKKLRLVLSQALERPIISSSGVEQSSSIPVIYRPRSHSSRIW